MKLENLKKWFNEHKIKKLVKNCILSILVVYFIISIICLGENYLNYKSTTTSSSEDFEIYLAEIQNDEMYGNYKERTLDEFIGMLKIIDFMEKHPNLSNIEPEEQSKLLSRVNDVTYEQNITIEDIKKSLDKDNSNSVSEFYHTTHYSRETFEDMLDLAGIEHTYYDIVYDEQVSSLKDYLEKNHYSVDTVIRELENDNIAILSDYLSTYGYQYYSIKYPYSMYTFQESLFKLSEQILNLEYSIIIGVIIGVIIYTYSNTRKISKFVIFSLLTILLVAFLEFTILNTMGGILDFGSLGIKIDNMDFSISAGFNVPIFNHISLLVACVVVVLSIVKVAMNKQQINKLNKLNEENNK